MKNAQAQPGSSVITKGDEWIYNGGVVNEAESQRAEAERLVRSAMDYVRELIRVNEGRWSFYRNVNASLLEQWLQDDHPNLHRCVIRIGAYDAFKKQLLEYCGRFSAATALAEMYLKKYFWSLHVSLVRPFRLEEHDREAMYESSNLDTESFFPGVAIDIESGRVGRVEELPGMVALLADRFLRIKHSNRHVNEIIALHSTLSECCREWCDLEKVRQSPVGTAFVVSRRVFSEELLDLTPERYALVMRMPADTSVDSLLQETRVAFCVEGRGPQPEHYLALSDGKLAVPALRNEELLLKFRNFIPIVFLVGEEMLLVEYEWNPTAFGSDFIAAVRDRQIHPCRSDTVVRDEAVTEIAADAVVITDVRWMPVIPGAPKFAAPDYVEPVWDDSIPF